MRQRIKKRIHHLRQQPPEERLKAVGSTVFISGAAILFLWLFLLLPIQLHVQVQTEGEREGLIASLLKVKPGNQIATESAQPSRTPQIGGIQDDDQYRRPLPSGPFFKTAQPDQSQSQQPIVATPTSAPLFEARQTPTPSPASQL